MSFHRLAESPVWLVGFAAGVVASIAVQLGTAYAASDGRLASADLLRVGFKLTAEGDLLMGRRYFVDRMRAGPSDPAFVAELPSFRRPDARHVVWLGDSYMSYVRLKRGVEEFVCILGSSDRCYQADGSKH